MLYGGAALVVFVLWVYCVIDCISTDETLVRNLPKTTWLLVVIFVPTVGSVAWLALGRPTEAGFYPNQPRRSPPRFDTRPPALPPVGPEDQPGFIESIEERRLRAWENDLKRREEELRRRETGEPPEIV